MTKLGQPDLVGVSIFFFFLSKQTYHVDETSCIIGLTRKTRICVFNSERKVFHHCSFPETDVIIDQLGKKYFYEIWLTSNIDLYHPKPERPISGRYYSYSSLDGQEK